MFFNECGAHLAISSCSLDRVECVAWRVLTGVWGFAMAEEWHVSPYEVI